MSAYTLVNALGRGVDASLAALRSGAGGLRPCDFDDAELRTWIGRVAGLEDEPVQGGLERFDCRNNRLALAALGEDGFADAVAAARARYGASRVGVFVGTSTSGVLQAEHAYRRRDPASGKLPPAFDYRHTLNAASAAELTREALGLEGPFLAVSTACSSSAKVFAAAHRYLHLGICDAAVVGGVDSLCHSTLYGFGSLGLVSDAPCRPWDAARSGMNIGEGAGFALLEKAAPEAGGLGLLGYGESSDAYHMSSPHPEGVGAALAMSRALESARVAPGEVDYVNLHGTGTAANDASEDLAVVRVLGDGVPCSSTKGWTGHTLGAAGITEAVFVLLALEHGFLPRTLNTDVKDPALSADVLLESREQPVRRALSNSFGFGGSNCSLLLGAIG